MTEGRLQREPPELPDDLSAAPTDIGQRSSPKRIAYASAGVVLVGIGAVGVFVPGLPTVIWLMGASYLFARSSPHLEAKLIRNRFFGAYLIYLDRPATMPRRARITATVLMWGSVGLSSAIMAGRGTLTAWFAATVVVAAAVGTWVVWRIGRPSPRRNSQLDQILRRF